MPQREAEGEEVPLALRQAVEVPLGHIEEETLIEAHRVGAALRVGEGDGQGLGEEVPELQPLREKDGEAVVLELLHVVGLMLGLVD